MESGEVIRRTRDSLGWTQEKFGKHLGWSSSSVKRWEGGEREVPHVVLDWCEVVLSLYQSVPTDWKTRFSDLVDEEGQDVDVGDMDLSHVIERLGLAEAIKRIQEEILLYELDQERASQGWH